MEPVFFASAGGFFTPEPPEKLGQGMSLNTGLEHEPKSASLQGPHPCSFCFSGETLSPEPESPLGFLGALLSGAVIRMLQRRLGPRRQLAPSRAPQFGLVLRSCWVVRARGAGPGVRGMERSRVGGGGPRPLQARSWAGSQVAGPAETRRPAPLQTSGTHTAADPGAPQPEGPVTPPPEHWRPAWPQLRAAALLRPPRAGLGGGWRATKASACPHS